MPLTFGKPLGLGDDTGDNPDRQFSAGCDIIWQFSVVTWRARRRRATPAAAAANTVWLGTDKAAQKVLFSSTRSTASETFPSPDDTTLATGSTLETQPDLNSGGSRFPS